MPSVKLARPKIARPTKGLAVVRPVRRAQVTSFMPGLGALPVRKAAPVAVRPQPKIRVTSFMPGLGAVEHPGVVKAGTTGRKPAPKVVRRAPKAQVTSFMPGLGAIAPVRAAVVRRTPVQVTTTRYMAPPAVTLAPQHLSIALAAPKMTLVPQYGGSAQQMPMMFPSPAGNGRRAASYEDTDAAIATENEDYMDFTAEGEDLGPMEDTDEAISTEDREFGSLGGLFDIQIGAGTIAIAAVAAWFLLRKKRA
jgi:hypothetical protein